MGYRKLSAEPEAATDFEAFLEQLNEALNNGSRDPNETVRNILIEIYFGPRRAGEQGYPVTPHSLSSAGRVLLHSLDPRNVTTEPEYYTDIDAKRYAERKPYIWLWQMFDRSPLGQNALLGHRVRQLLAPFIFSRVGRNFKCWQMVEWSFGYNLSFGDNVVIHRHVLLDDRGGIDIGNNVSISDYVNIYSHTHDLDDIDKVYAPRTRIGDGARITYHATILAGITIGEQSMVGSGAVVTTNVEPYHIVVGIPARTVRVKSPPQPETAAVRGS